MTSIIKQILPFLIIIQGINGQPPSFPPYSQQCRDDAGPPFNDDGETFPGEAYHTGKPAYPMLKADGKCAKPLEKACFDRGNKRTAYLEGPIDCGGNGWYCRILEDPNWDSINLVPDFNFSPCNVTKFGDFYGHCHGSSDESTYYWWLRDHWYRQYNGRLRCCCDWGKGEDPLTGGGWTDRCDYRRLVTSSENLQDCRDANEDHGLNWEGGCDPDRLQEQLGKPLPEDEERCWEIQRWGEPREGNDDDFTQPPSMVTGPTPSPSKSDATPTGRPSTTVEPTSDGDNPTPAPTAGPTAGPTPTSTPPPTPSNSNTLLISTLDSKWSVRKLAKGFGRGQTNLAKSDFVIGKDKKGANISEDGKFIRFRAAIKKNKRVKKNINFKNGAITFWYKPSYSYSSSGDEEDKVLVSVGKPNKEKMTLGMAESLYFTLKNGEYETVVEDEDLWTAGQWVFIKITWNHKSTTNSIKIFVDNKRVDTSDVEGGWKLGSEFKSGHIYVGSMNRDGDSPANGIIDSFKVYKTSNV